MAELGGSGQAHDSLLFQRTRTLACARNLSAVSDARVHIASAMAAATLQQGGGEAASGAGDGPQRAAAGGSCLAADESALRQLAELRAEVAGMQGALSLIKGGRLGTLLPTVRRVTSPDWPLAAGPAAATLPQPQRCATKLPAAAAALLPKNAAAGNSAQLSRSPDLQAAGRPGRASPCSVADLFQEVALPHGQTALRPRASPSPVPVGREEALLLEVELEQQLPAGALLAQLRTQLQATSSSRRQAAAEPQSQPALAAASCGVQCSASPDINSVALPPAVMDCFQQLDALMQAAATQVAASCIERGRVVDKLRLRYAELLNAVALSNSGVASRLSTAAAEAAWAGGLVEQQSKELQMLRRDLAAASERAAILQQDLECSHERLAELESSSTDAVERLQRSNQSESQRVEQLVQQLRAQQVAQEAAVVGAGAEAAAALAAAQKEVWDVQQRMLYLDRQLAAIRASKQANHNDKEAQTEADEPAAPPPEPLPAPPPPAADQLLQEAKHDAADSEEDDTEADLSQAARHKKRLFGGFASFLKSTRPGKVRGRPWLIKVLGQIYADKIAADAVDARQGAQPSTLCEFVVGWHLTRYGLRHLSEPSLVDLLASARHHAAMGCPISHWFAHFCALTPGEKTYPRHDPDPQELSFYLFSLQQLAGSGNVASLFPESEEGPAPLKGQLITGVVQLVFKRLEDSDGAAAFVARSLDQAAVSQVQLAALQRTQSMAAAAADAPPTAAASSLRSASTCLLIAVPGQPGGECSADDVAAEASDTSLLSAGLGAGTSAVSVFTAPAGAGELESPRSSSSKQPAPLKALPERVLHHAATTGSSGLHSAHSASSGSLSTPASPSGRAAGGTPRRQSSMRAASTSPTPRRAPSRGSSLRARGGATSSDLYDAHTLLGLLMGEYQRCRGRSIAALNALYRAGDVDSDGCLSLVEFRALMQLAEGSWQGHRVTGLFQEALAHPANRAIMRRVAGTGSDASSQPLTTCSSAINAGSEATSGCTSGGGSAGATGTTGGTSVASSGRPSSDEGATAAAATIMVTRALQQPRGEQLGEEAFVAICLRHGIAKWQVGKGRTQPLAVLGALFHRPLSAGSTSRRGSKGSTGSADLREADAAAASCSTTAAGTPGRVMWEGALPCGDGAGRGRGIARSHSFCAPSRPQQAQAAGGSRLRFVTHAGRVVKAKMRADLDSTLAALSPPLDEQLARLRVALGSQQASAPLLAYIEDQAAHMNALMAEVGESSSPGACWLAWQVLRQLLEEGVSRTKPPPKAAAGRSTHSRPGTRRQIPAAAGAARAAAVAALSLPAPSALAASPSQTKCHVPDWAACVSFGGPAQHTARPGGQYPVPRSS